LYFSRPILEKIPDYVQSAKYKDFEVTFRDRVAAIESEAQSAGLEIPIELPIQYQDLFRQNTNRLHVVVVEAWSMVERAIREKFPWDYESPSKKAPISALITMLYKEKILSEEEFAILRDFQSVRNRAAHERVFPLRESDVLKYLKLSAALERRISELPNR